MMQNPCAELLDKPLLQVVTEWSSVGEDKSRYGWQWVLYEHHPRLYLGIHWPSSLVDVYQMYNLLLLEDKDMMLLQTIVQRFVDGTSAAARQQEDTAVLTNASSDVVRWSVNGTLTEPVCDITITVPRVEFVRWKVQLTVVQAQSWLAALAQTRPASPRNRLLDPPSARGSLADILQHRSVPAF